MIRGGKGGEADAASLVVSMELLVWRSMVLAVNLLHREFSDFNGTTSGSDADVLLRLT